MIVINNQEEMKLYYNEKINMYLFNDDVKFICDIVVDSGINAWDINALDIKALDIKAENINANNISFYSVCFARETFVCESIEGIRENSKYFCLDSEVVIKSQKS